MHKLLSAIFLMFSGFALAEANYSLTCDMSGSSATVYACNSGNSAEGNNRYVTVTACDDRDCDSTYELMYIYASAGQCDAVGSVSFNKSKEYCFASFRP